MPRLALAAYTDPDELMVLKIPRGWEIGREYEPQLDSLVIGGKLKVNLVGLTNPSWAYKPMLLDGANGIAIGCWAEFSLTCDKATSKALLDARILKNFCVSLTSPHNRSLAVDRELYVVVFNPEVAVQKTRQK